MTVVVPLIRDANDDALSTAIKIARQQDMTLVAILSRPVSEFDQISIDEEIDALSDRLDREDIAYGARRSRGNRLNVEGIKTLKKRSP